MPKHGELVDGHLRWCEACGYNHGLLYPCENYPPEILLEIQSDSDKFKINLNDGAWIKDQVDNGIPVIAISIMRTFAE